MKRLLTGISVFFALFSTTLILQSGQVQNGANTASINGTITDPSGATIANAAVELKSASKGALLHTISTTTGRYEFKNLQADKYQLTVAAAGFKTFRRDNIQVAARQNVRIDAMLEVGTASESISITGDASLLRTDSGQSSPMVINGKVYLGDEDGDVVVLEAAKEKKLIGEMNMGSSVYATPVPAHGTLFIMNRNQLWAFSNK